MNPIELRLNIDAVRPLVEHIRPLADLLSDKLASSAAPPEDDSMIADFWRSDLLGSQRQDVEAILSIFDEVFMETGRAIIEMDEADQILRGCTAMRLILRTVSLAEVPDEELECGDIDFEQLGKEARMGYGVYMLFASLQELIIAQMDPSNKESELGVEDEETFDGRDE